MALMFGSNEARAVLLADRERRIGHTRMNGQKDPDGKLIPAPAHYVAATWSDWEPEEDEGDGWDDEEEEAVAD